MRQDNLDVSNPPTDDRPGDHWMIGPETDSSGQAKRALTWSGRRRRLATTFLIVATIAAVTTVLIVPSAEIVKPGDLSTPHAQILAGEVGRKKCGACHSQAARSPLAWFLRGSDSHSGVRQNDRCVACHHRTIPENLAHAAHNLPLSTREALTESIRLASRSNDRPNEDWQDGGRQYGLSLHQWIPDAAVDQNAVACSTCHKEHGGADVNLMAMSDEQCQTCHSKRFGSLADSHPDWNRWPYGRGGHISFNHVSHQSKHFPGWKSGGRRFDCAICHPDAATISGAPTARAGEVVRVASYQRSCQRCHDQALDVQVQQGIDFVSLPSLPDEAASGVDGWPERATGFADGAVSPLTELMLRADPNLSDFIRGIPGGQLSRLPLHGEVTDRHLVQLGIAIRDLVTDVGSHGQASIQERLTELGISTAPFRPVLRSLPPQLIQSASETWFARSNPTIRRSAISTRALSRIRLVGADEQSLLDDALLIGDGQAGERFDGDVLTESSEVDPLLEPLPEDLGSGFEKSTATENAANLVREGGWYRDDERLAIRYLSYGHADSVMVGIIETFAQLGDADPLKQRFLKQPAVAACVACHDGAMSIPARWKSTPLVGNPADFTKFSHRPHLNVSALGDCVYCHQLSNRGNEHHSAPAESVVEFQPITRQDCAACHHAEAAGERCTQCHRYHLGR